MQAAAPTPAALPVDAEAKAHTSRPQTAAEPATDTAKEHERRAADLSSDFALRIDYARTIGSLLYRHERAAERANALLATAHAALPPDALGWVTEQVDGQGTVQVTFVAGSTQRARKWRAWGRVLVRRDAADQLLPQTLPALSQFERNKLTARNTALAIRAADCGSNVRVVVIAWRRAGQDIFLAYRLSDSGSENQVLLGGQHEFVLDAQGRSLLQHQTSEPGCHTAQRDAHTRYLTSVTEGRSTPSLFDVYVSLRQALPVRLTTLANGLHWQLNGDKVRLLKPHEAGEAGEAEGAEGAEERAAET